jgi:hypothetical protein
MGWGRIKRKFKRSIRRVASNPVVQAVSPWTAVAAGAAGGRNQLVTTLRNTGAVQVGQAGGMVGAVNPLAGSIVSGAVDGSGIVGQIDDMPRPTVNHALAQLPTQAEARGYGEAPAAPASLSPLAIAGIALGAVALGLLIWKATK